MKHPRWQIPTLWPGETVVVLGGGPSLTREQVEACRGACRVIAVNTAYQVAPWADLLYFCDWEWLGWWKADPAFRSFAGLRVALENARSWEVDPSILVVENYGNPEPPECVGIAEPGDGLFTHRSAGAQAIELAAKLGAARILLLGFDMRAVNGRTHYHMSHRRPTIPRDYEMTMLPWFAPLGEALRARGVEVVNCTPGSAIACFRRSTVERELMMETA